MEAIPDDDEKPQERKAPVPTYDLPGFALEESDLPALSQALRDAFILPTDRAEADFPLAYHCLATWGRFRHHIEAYPALKHPTHDALRALPKPFLLAFLKDVRFLLLSQCFAFSARNIDVNHLTMLRHLRRWALPDAEPIPDQATPFLWTSDNGVSFLVVAHDHNADNKESFECKVHHRKYKLATEAAAKGLNEYGIACTVDSLLDVLQHRDPPDDRTIRNLMQDAYRARLTYYTERCTVVTKNLQCATRDIIDLAQQVIEILLEPASP